MPPAACASAIAAIVVPERTRRQPSSAAGAHPVRGTRPGPRARTPPRERFPAVSSAPRRDAASP